jgi:DNA-directed RNA polymerase alpha subunit
VGDVLELLDKGESDMLSIRNLGDKSLTELKAAIVEKGYLEKEEEVE